MVDRGNLKYAGVYFYLTLVEIDVNKSDDLKDELHFSDGKAVYDQTTTVNGDVGSYSFTPADTDYSFVVEPTA